MMKQSFFTVVSIAMKGEPKVQKGLSIRLSSRLPHRVNCLTMIAVLCIVHLLCGKSVLPLYNFLKTPYNFGHIETISKHYLSLPVKNVSALSDIYSNVTTNVQTGDYAQSIPLYELCSLDRRTDRIIRFALAATTNHPGYFSRIFLVLLRRVSIRGDEI